jgi:hypothetical protein
MGRRLRVINLPRPQMVLAGDWGLRPDHQDVWSQVRLGNSARDLPPCKVSEVQRTTA